MDTISELKDKATELRKIADKLDAAANALIALGGQPDAAVRQTVTFSPSELVGGDLRELSGVDAIQRVLHKAGTPLKKNEILERLKVGGKAIAYGTLEAYLSREKKLFKSVGRGKWWLVSESFLAA